MIILITIALHILVKYDIIDFLLLSIVYVHCIVIVIIKLNVSGSNDTDFAIAFECDGGFLCEFNFVSLLEHLNSAVIGTLWLN